MAEVLAVSDRDSSPSASESTLNAASEKISDRQKEKILDNHQLT